MSEKRKGMLIVLSGASGTGKGTLIKELMAADESLVFSVSATTRAPRPEEIHGVHYYFVTDAEYDQLVADNAFVEHATVHGNRYGTLRSEVDARLERGENVLLDIDVQGALNVIASEKNMVSIFILPPSMKILRERLTDRGTESAEVIERRLHNAVWEIAQRDKYDYQVINDNMMECLHTLQAIIQAEKQASIRYHVELTEE